MSRENARRASTSLDCRCFPSRGSACPKCYPNGERMRERAEDLAEAARQERIRGEADKAALDRISERMTNGEGCSMADVVEIVRSTGRRC